jgi:hypothetical protein
MVIDGINSGEKEIKIGSLKLSKDQSLEAALNEFATDNRGNEL